LGLLPLKRLQIAAIPVLLNYVKTPLFMPHNLIQVYLLLLNPFNCPAEELRRIAKGLQGYRYIQ